MNASTTESGATVVAKLSPPASVSLATIAGYPVSDIVLWVTLFYTSLLIVQKLWQMYKDFTK